MTLAELENKLPNGFHDTMIYGINVDYKDQTVALDVELSYSGPDDPSDVPEYRRAKLIISGLKLFVIEPPKSGALDGDELFAQGFVTDSDEHWENIIDPKLVEAVGSDAPLYSFFVNHWNSCIHIAATSATYEWSDGKQ